MSNLLPFPNRTLALEEASTWLVKADRGLTPGEREEMQRWVDQSPLNRQALAEAVAIWDDVDMVSELAEIFPLERYAAHPHSAKAGPPFFRIGVAAAALLLVMTVGWLALDLRNPEAVADLPLGYGTELGQQTAVPLPDGSRVTLNTDSKVAIRFVASEREVVLERGEAYFEVAHDPDRPFRVRTAAGTVTAVGTAFSVRLRESGIGVLVAEGVVTVAGGADGGAGERVGAGELATLDAAGVSLMPLTAVSLEAGLAWRRGMLIFNDEPLELALAEFSRYSPMQFVFADDSIRRIPVGGYFRVGDVEGLLLALEKNFQIRVERNRADRVVLSGR